MAVTTSRTSFIDCSALFLQFPPCRVPFPCYGGEGGSEVIPLVLHSFKANDDAS